MSEQPRSRAICTQRRSRSPSTSWPVGLHGLEASSACKPAALDLFFEMGQRNLIALFRVEEDGDGNEGLEDAEQFLIRGVVGQKVAHVDVAQGSCQPREGHAPAAGDADIAPCVLRRLALTVERVVEIGYLLPQSHVARNRAIFLRSGIDGDRIDAAAARRAARPFPACPGPDWPSPDRHIQNPADEPGASRKSRRCAARGESRELRVQS